MNDSELRSYALRLEELSETSQTLDRKNALHRMQIDRMEKRLDNVSDRLMRVEAETKQESLGSKSGPLPYKASKSVWMVGYDADSKLRESDFEKIFEHELLECITTVHVGKGVLKYISLLHMVCDLDSARVEGMLRRLMQANVLNKGYVGIEASSFFGIEHCFDIAVIEALDESVGKAAVVAYMRDWKARSALVWDNGETLLFPFVILNPPKK